MNRFYTPNILVIDDDLDTIGLMRLVLQRAGYNAITATSWDEVVDRITLANEQGQRVDLIILDIMMPERSGFDVFNSLQVVLHPMPPVIFLSAKSTLETMVKASDLGAAKYLVKPTTKEKLLSTVEQVLQDARFQHFR